MTSERNIDWLTILSAVLSVGFFVCLFTDRSGLAFAFMAANLPVWLTSRRRQKAAGAAD